MRKRLSPHTGGCNGSAVGKAGRSSYNALQNSVGVHVPLSGFFQLRILVVSTECAGNKG